MCLGGKATSTNRASNLRGFIREGANAAEIKLTIKNRGSDAYRHDVYGDRIQIVRRITKDGSTYSIKSEKGTFEYLFFATNTSCTL